MIMYKNENVLLGLSGGINSMALLCWLVESGIQPKNLFIFYADFEEHSPGTFEFVEAGVAYAKKHFPRVHVRITRNSVIQYFREQNMIPHPANSPCSKKLKIDGANSYAFENDVKIDLVGYVRHELKRRGERQSKNAPVDLFSLRKDYPIGDFTDEWCFEIVEKHIGWFPDLYKHHWDDPEFMKFVEENLHRFDDLQQNQIRKKLGKHIRVFKHNNCLPCKNMYPWEILCIEYFYPSHYKKAMQLSSDLERYWGRSDDDFYFTFGRELGQDSTCTTCKF